MAIEMYNHCVLCNPAVNWLEIEFRSENDEPINDLKVTITNPSTLETHQQTSRHGDCMFANLTAGEWVISVETENLLATVEQYKSRKEQTPSPVESRAESELGAAHQNRKKYAFVSVGDLWPIPPQDTFLTEHHRALKANAREDIKGVRASHNTTHVLEIKALRSYMPMIVDTDEFSLVNSYTFAILSQLAYANSDYGDPRNEKVPQGGHDEILKSFQAKLRPTYSADREVTWLLDEIPYSQALKGTFYHDDTIGAEGYILSNDTIAIIGVRGTETYFYNKDAVLMADISSRLPILKVTEVADGVIAAIGSSGYQDVLTDIDASQISPPEFAGAYVHQGFYQYALALWNKILLNADNLKNKTIYVCGHSLGGAGALVLSSIINNTVEFKKLRLYTYGMPRTGTHSFVRQYDSIVHYRHVNNHDVVPQVPMRWMNTNPDNKCDSSLLWKYLSPTLLYLWDSLKERTTDCDEDNYQHHGNLIQLLTYSQAKHQPDDVKQVMLTEKQTHVTSLTLASNKTEDSYRLAKTLSNDHIDINGYVDTITNSGLDHRLGEYIPNLKQQLTLMLNNTAVENYQSAHQIIHQTEAKLLETYHALKRDEINALAMHAISRKDPAAYAQREHERTQALFSVRQELKLTEKITLNVQRIRKELDALVKTPEILPNKELLFGDQTIEIETVKEQLQ